ncbi:MAG TPA: HAMP domain-containing sensor histidine kinase [Kofleriaceae bacterium]
MRRVLLLNALIFAVLAAAVALAYYGFSYTSEDRSRERELTQELADEKVDNIEALIDDADKKLLRGVQLDPMSDLQSLVRSSGAAVASVFVLDDQLQIVPDGYVSNPAIRQPKEGLQFRDYFKTRILPVLPLKKAPFDRREHLTLRENSKPGEPLGRDYLFSFMRRRVGDRTFYVVIEDDLNDLVFRTFPQFLPVATSPRLYQVVDERGKFRYGLQFASTGDNPPVESKFSLTVDDWKLLVSLKESTDTKAIERKRVVDSVLIGGAMAVILLGLLVLGFAIRRERRLSDLKSEFISNVSHELKTPLSIISMFGEMLALGRTKSPEQATEYAKTIYSESVRLGRLIDNVLDFSRIERGMGSYEFAEADPIEVVENAIELSQRRVAAAEMTLETDVEPELPMARLDQNAFTLAVLNLIDNAIKYAGDGKKIRLSLSRHGNDLVLAVRDWGPGIEPDEQDRIFERFYRAKSIRLKPIRGSGIGLALVQHIARAHGGEARVDSKVGEGATFSMTIPIDGKN